MIAYFDTSALIPLLVAEPGSDAAGELWDHALRVVSVRLARVEARAALGQAVRTGRLTKATARRLVTELDGLLAQLDLVEIDEALVHAAADLADTHGLRAYDAVHLAGALTLEADELVVVAGDQALLAAAHDAGLATAAVR